tara:strand:- start:159670 stop:160557 length:888 start_codon:yes stop_codon:yes gene_type:complete
MNVETANYFKTTDGEQIFYSTNFSSRELTSDDTVLMFNYGLVCSNHHWSKQLSFFDEKGYKILIHDYRGHYQSTGKSQLENITFKNIASDMKELCDYLGIQSTVQIGHSMGVNVALEFARRWPELTKKVVVISGTAIPVYNIMFDTNLTEQVTPALIKGLSKFPTIFKSAWKYGGWNPIVKKLVHHGGFNVDTVPEEFIEIYLNRLGVLGPELFFQLIEQMNKHDILSYLPQIESETLVIGGDQDKVIPNYLQKLLVKELPNAKLYLVRKGSHVPQVDFPSFINERIDLFLTQSL